jgi:putative oxidoreductase
MAVLGRVLIALLFVAGAAQKLSDPGVVAGMLAGVGLPGWLVWPVAAFNAAGAVALVIGWRLFPVALALAAYCGVTSLFHLIPADPWQMSIFVKNWAIAGGLLVLADAARHEGPRRR